MQYRWFCSLAVMILFTSVMPICAQEPPSPPDTSSNKISVPIQVQPREIRDYKADFDVRQKRKPGDTSNVELDAAVSYKIRHSYIQREDDGTAILEVSLLEGQITTGGQTLQITPSLYPKLTVLLDRNFSISDVFGAAGSRVAQGLPGVNYGNLIIFFYPVGADRPRTIGESWKTRLRVPSLKQTYDIQSTLKALEVFDGKQVVRISQDYVLESDPLRKITTDSLFSLKDGRLVKSHIECEISIPADASTGRDGQTATASVRVEISAVK